MQKRNLLLGLLLGAVASASAQNLSVWPKYKSIAINTKATGANVAADVAKFPVLVRLNATNANDIFTEAAAGGADLRFGNAAGQPRPFEIESWDATAKRAAIWVLADTVQGNDSLATLRVYWGVPGAPSASNPGAVFDTANGFVAVWHMNGSGNETDATVNGFTATSFGSPAVNDTSAIGKGRRFTGTQHFQVLNSAGSKLNLPLDGRYTLSAWTYADSVVTAENTGHAIVNKGDHQWTLATYASGASKTYEITTKAGNNQWRQTTTASTTNPVYAGVLQNDHVKAWRYVAGSWNGTEATDTGRVYFEGAHQKFATWNNTSTDGRNPSVDVHIGGLPSPGAGVDGGGPTGDITRPWLGTLDEIRISSVTRDSNWIRLEYATQMPSAATVVLGSTQTQTPAAFDVAYSPSTVSYATGLAISPASPTVLGTGTPTAWTVTPGLPTGLSLNATTGRISGTPTAAAAGANYTVRAANATDTAYATINITVVNAANEDYAGTAWPNKQMIWLNTQSNGAGVSAGVAKFPVLVRLDTSNFNAGFGQAAAGGADIRFTKPNNTTRLPHQIEMWDAGAKKAAVWVLLDTIVGGGIDSLRMHWGNASAPSLSSGPSVFDTANGFEAVWHMNAASGNEMDATVNGFSAVAAGAPGTASGAVGPARTFNGTTQFFSVPGTASGVLNFSQADSYTLSSWINPTAISDAGNTGHKIIDKGDNQYVLATYGPDAASRYWEITIKGNDTWNQCQADGATGVAVLASSSIGGWHHLVGTYTGAASGTVTQRLYYDGVKVAECPISNDSPDGRTETFDVHLGVQAEGTAPGSAFSRHWNGLLDEPRLASKARSEAWVKLEFQNQKASQSLVTFTRPGVVSVARAASMAAQGFSVKGMGQGVVFQLQNAHEGKAVLSLVDMWGRTVWTGSFAPGSTQLAWNGVAKSGKAPSGVYVARLTLLDNQGKMVQVYDRKVPYTR